LPIESSCEGILHGLRTFSAMGDDEHRKMSMCGLELSRRRFSPQINCEALKEVYRWLKRTGPRPACVVRE
jgi:hypothetical protein